jgi:Bacterial-like globin
LRESHARFRIGPAQRRAWLKHMAATLDATPLDEATRKALRQFFEHSSAYVIGKEAAGPEDDELAARWGEQRVLDHAVAAIADGHDHEAMVLAPRFVSRPAVFVGVLARMIQSGRADLIRFVIDAVERDPATCNPPFRGTYAPPLRFRRWLPGGGGIVAPTRHGSRHTTRRRPHAALLCGEPMRVRNGTRSGAGARASGC